MLDAVHRFHVVALVGHPPRGQGERSRVVVVESFWFEVGLEGCGGLLGVVARHIREQVVRHVGAPDVVVHPVKRAVRAVDGAQSAAHPGPLVFAEVRQVGRGVLQPSVQHQPRVGPHVPVFEWVGGRQKHSGKTWCEGKDGNWRKSIS